MHSKLPAAIMAAALTGGTAASAQDTPQQTVEGAQRFIAVLAQNGQLQFEGHHYVWPSVGLEYKINGAVAGNCTTQLTGQPIAYAERGSSGYWVNTSASNWKPQKFEQLRARFGIPALPVTIDWSRVTSIGIVAVTNDLTNDNGQRQTVRVTWSGGFVALNTHDDALAKRLEYAANFLKAACARTAETGF